MEHFTLNQRKYNARKVDTKEDKQVKQFSHFTRNTLLNLLLSDLLSTFLDIPQLPKKLFYSNSFILF